MENIRKEYDGVVGELVERAELILKENGGDIDGAIMQAIDDGFYYDDDRAYVLAWALENGVIEWGRSFDWFVIDDMLREDIAYELKRGSDMKGRK